MDRSLHTAEQTLFETGYAARQFGKWHLGEKTRIPAYADDPELRYRDHFGSIAARMRKPANGPISRVGRPTIRDRGRSERKHPV